MRLNGPAPKEGDSPMYCTACGVRNTQDANFCKQCGHKLDKTSPVAISEEDFAIPPGPDDRVEKLLVTAFQEYEAGDLDGAIQACSEALTIRPESTSAHSLMGTLYEKRGERDKAIAEYEKVLLLNPGSIADREKLDQLRDGTALIVPRKITSSRRLPGRALFDSPTGAAVAAVATFLLVLLVGAWAVYMRGGKQTTQAASRPIGAPLPLTGGAQRAAQSTSPYQTQYAAPNGAGAQNLAATNFDARSAIQSQRNAPATPRRERQPRGEDEPSPRSFVPPATVALAPPGRDFDDARNVNGSQGGSTIHLPENGLAPSEIGPPPASARAAQSNAGTVTPANVAANPAPANPKKTGRIEIVVTQEPQRGSGAGRTISDSGSQGANMDSRSTLAYARQLQMSGNYSRAVTQYTKALDGAGDDAASIHQQIALCYQRLDQKDSAVTHYNDAIASFKAQISAGHNVEAANRGIKTCEAGIRACQ